MASCFLLLALLTFPTAATPLPDTEAVSAANDAPVQVEMGFGYEWLSGGMPDWNTQSLEIVKGTGQNAVLNGIFRLARRYEQQDVDMALGISHPLNNDWITTWELAVSPTSHISPKWSALGGVHYNLHHGWLAGADTRWTAYDDVSVARLILSLEHYWGNFRSAYSLSMNTLWGGETVDTHQLAVNVYYDEKSSLGLIYATGTELEKVSSAVVSNDIDALVAVGRHWFADRWALSYECGWNRVGTHHSGTGIRLGLRYEL